MKVRWIEGEWKDDEPVIPEDHDYVWYVVDYKYARPHCVEPHSVRTVMLCHYFSNQQQDKNCKKPNWWWAPQERPDKLPANHPRTNW